MSNVIILSPFMTQDPQRLFTPRFFLMCGFSFTVFLSAFQLLPTAPFHIKDLGGSTFAAGLFLGFLTYASAFSAPFTGALGDRIGRRTVLMSCSLILAGFLAAYAVISSYRLLLALVILHGVFWSGLMSASAAYVTAILPEHRRAEGIGYWGLSTIAAIAVAPPIGFWVYRHGWVWLCAVTVGLNLLMAGIAWSLDDTEGPGLEPGGRRGPLLEWRVLAVSLCLFLYSYGYGGITSFTAVYADAIGVHPKGLYLTTLAVVILMTRPLASRLGDRIGYTRVFIPALVLISIGLALLAIPGGRGWLMLSAVVFGGGFGTAYPVFAAYVLKGVAPERRGAAFGAILAAFDTGIGTGSTLTGWLIDHYGFQPAFGTAAALSALAVPYFVFADRRFMRKRIATETQRHGDQDSQDWPQRQRDTEATKSTN